MGNTFKSGAETTYTRWQACTHSLAHSPTATTTYTESYTDPQEHDPYRTKQGQRTEGNNRIERGAGKAGRTCPYCKPAHALSVQTDS